MDSNKHHHHHQHHHHNHNQQHQPQQPPQQNMNSGLTRYRSAPSSYFSNLINNGVYGDEDLDPFFNSRIPETNRNLSSFMSDDDNLSSHQNLDHIREQQQQMMYQNHVHNNNSSVVSSSSSSAAMVDPLMGTNLVRQSSSPAGVLEHINIDNGYPMMRSMDRFQPSVPDSTFSSASRASSRLLSRIPEHDGKTMTRNNGGYVGSFDVGSWDESSMLSDGFMNEFVESDQQKLNDEGRVQSVHAPTGLTHQLSLPTSSTELYVKEEQFQDSVLLRSRAKRGCATHPRSIAERVRRTRISERMRKLQDLVPNMDKQTSTADMLDLAVDYIKELQNQVETLSDRQTKCTCQRKLKL